MLPLHKNRLDTPRLQEGIVTRLADLGVPYRAVYATFSFDEIHLSVTRWPSPRPPPASEVPAAGSNLQSPSAAPPLRVGVVASSA